MSARNAFEEITLLRFLQQVSESAEAMSTLVETGFAAPNGLFDQ